MNHWAGRMAQFLKVLAVKPDEPSSVPCDGTREATPQSARMHTHPIPCLLMKEYMHKCNKS